MDVAELGKEARMLDPIFQRFVDQSPITVMAGAALARLLSAQRLDALFEKARQGQYAHQLLFSTVFDLMAAVVAGTRRSIHHAYQTATQEAGASVVAVYAKLKGIETSTSQALVRDIAGELAPLIDQMGGALEPPAPGYRTRILDGNCIAASEHRIKELRTVAAGALPGKSLVVLDADRRLIADVFPCEDGHAQERALLEQVVPTIQAGDLWIDDRNSHLRFPVGHRSTPGFLYHPPARQHGLPTALGPQEARKNRDRHGLRAAVQVLAPRARNYNCGGSRSTWTGPPVTVTRSSPC
jgi:hypothetical protein